MLMSYFELYIEGVPLEELIKSLKVTILQKNFGLSDLVTFSSYIGVWVT